MAVARWHAPGSIAIRQRSRTHFPECTAAGIDTHGHFEETRLQPGERNHLALFAIGLLEARSPNGELYSFERLRTLFASQPTAEQAAQAAVNFGLDEDIAVLTLTPIPAEIGSTMHVPLSGAVKAASLLKKKALESCAPVVQQLRNRNRPLELVVGSRSVGLPITLQAT
jgi:hypothetical protein